MKRLFTLCFILISTFSFAQSPGDTIVIETFNYTQTHGSGIRDTMIDFPSSPYITFEKIIMLYNMRCKNGLVSTTSDRNKGCGEWDYSCNTYIHDSSRTDSVLSFIPSHSISNFSGNQFNYVEMPTHNYYQYLQKNVEIDATNSETLSAVGDGSLALPFVVDATQYSGKSQFIFTAAELSAAGVSAGDINGLLLNALVFGNADAGYFKVKLKQTEKTVLSASDPDFEDFTEVYFHDFAFAAGANRIQFHTPFNWDGTSNLLIEFSFTNKNPGIDLEMEGSATSMVSGIYSTNGTSLNNFNGEIEIPTEPFSSITEEITISFWSFGNAAIQPVNNSFIHANDGNGNRTVNIHLPWSNSNIYWDCGNEGGSYDRINKAATPEEYEGKWNHWAFSKNASTGEMFAYLNGQLWHSGTDMTRLIDIQNFLIGNSQAGNLNYAGKIDEVRIWDKALSETTIKEWMYKSLDSSHPDYDNLVAYYKIDEGTGNTTMDASIHGKTGQINGHMYWVYDRGDQLNREFTETMNRPNITFAQGDYELSITDEIVTDSVANIPNVVKEYEIIPRWGTLKHDSINLVSENEFWEAGYEVTYDPDGIALDSTMVVATGTIEISELTYYRRYPMWFEIMSFVTPYGINLDLGMDGKTWAFDVTDYAPILQGSKRMTVERGGQWQEDMDIKFLFIVGTPPRDVLDVQQLWRADAVGYQSIMADRAFEPRDVKIMPYGSEFKIKSTITGHGQQGEFNARFHYFKINGNEEFNRKVWTECSTNAIYPQGGTWIYDRAGWCPGQPSDMVEYDITNLVTPGGTTNIDYGLEVATGTSNYIVNNQLVTYNGPNFTLDAAVVEVLKPNSSEASRERFNPACSYPEIVIRNTGSATLTSLDIEYYEQGGEAENFHWTGSLEFLDTALVVLPVDDISFWMPATNEFVVTISNPNGEIDQYEFNNTYRTKFEGVDVFPETDIIVIECKTNNYGWQTNYTLYDGDGNVYLEWDDLDDNTLYSSPFILDPGCYKLQINDKADDGLYWWNGSTQGTGSMKVKNYDGQTLYTFEPEFGRFAVYEFGIGEITSTEENINKPFFVNAYPNPASDQVNIEIRGLEKQEVKLRLSNTIMATVYEKTTIISGDEFNTNIDIHHLPSGLYILEIEYGDLKTVKKIIKK